MELMQLNNVETTTSNSIMEMEKPPFDPPYEVMDIEAVQVLEDNPSPFIEANTVSCRLTEIRRNHMIPSFAKDGEPLISHADFIESTMRLAADVFQGERILTPSIRLSHEIRGRIPSAKDKPANQLEKHEKTLFYERMAFAIEIPSIKGNVDGNNLSLMVGGVKNYNADNLYNKIGAEQHFKLFIGFKNSVCTNSCISTDGLLGNITVANVGQLRSYIRMLMDGFNHKQFLNSLQTLSGFNLTEIQFAHLIGRCRMYQHLPKGLQVNIPSMQFGENQLSNVIKDYYRDNNFSRNADGTISLWKLYNLFTGANKSSYIDSFADRAVNAYSFVESIKTAMEDRSENWFLNQSFL